MVKYLIVLVNAMVLSLIGFFFNDKVTVQVNTPEQVCAGEEFLVELKISKGDITGFAKIQTELPEGLTAEAANLGNGGTLTFRDNVVKIMWWNLPPEEELTATYKVIVPPSYTDDISLEGVFSYIHESEKQVIELEEKTIKLCEGSSEVAQNGGSETSETEAQANTESSNATPSVSITRSISKNNIKAGESIEVTLNLKTSNVKGFAKIQETIPSGFSVKEGSSNGAAFSNTGKLVKLLWMDFPDQSTFSVTYTLIADESVSGSFSLSNAVFSYVDPNKTNPEKFIIPANTFNVAGNKAETPAEKTSQPPVAKTPSKPRKTVAKKVDGLNYRVQISATHSDVTVEYFVKNHNVQEEIYMEMHEGWTKFTVGNFSVYKDARDYREQVRNNYSIVGPFVTAYNDGTRITVQEALMMSNQRWYP